MGLGSLKWGDNVQTCLACAGVAVVLWLDSLMREFGHNLGRTGRLLTEFEFKKVKTEGTASSPTTNLIFFKISVIKRTEKVYCSKNCKPSPSVYIFYHCFISNLHTFFNHLIYWGHDNSLWICQYTPSINKYILLNNHNISIRFRITNKITEYTAYNHRSPIVLELFYSFFSADIDSD